MRGAADQSVCGAALAPSSKRAGTAINKRRMGDSIGDRSCIFVAWVAPDCFPGHVVCAYRLADLANFRSPAQGSFEGDTS